MKKILVILGPTATGKTEIAIKLAKKFDGVLIAADSRQVYKGLDIGTGKYSSGDSFKKFSGEWLLNDVWIHGYDLVEVDSQFTAADFAKFFAKTIKKIWKMGKLPILIGGTGFYIKAALEGFETLGIPADSRLRAKLKKLSKVELFEMLAKIDKGKADNLSPSDRFNPQRLIRAIEVAKFLKSHSKPVPMYPYIRRDEVDVAKIGLDCRREVLYKRIDERIDWWFKIGFVEEVKNLIDKFGRNAPALTSLGYDKVSDYLDGKYSLEDAKQKVKFAHHDFARRQITWFRRDPEIIWFDITNGNYFKKVEKQVKKWLNRGRHADKN